MTDAWAWWSLDLYRASLELDDRLTPPGCAIELEIHLDGDGLTVAWVWSATGAVLRLVEVGRA